MSASRAELQPDPETDLVDLAALWQALWAGRRRILAAMLIAVAIGAAYVFALATPVYKATAVMMLESRKTSVAGLDSVLGELGTTTTAIRTEIEVMRGRNLMGRVAERLDLAADPEFNAALRPPGLRQRLGSIFSGTEAQPLRDGHDLTVSALLEKVEIANLPGSFVFQITASSASPARAVEIANAVAGAYIDEQLDLRFQATETAAAWLSGQLASLRTSLEEAEAAVRIFRNETPLIDAQTLAAMDRQLKETRSRLDQARLRAAEIGAKLAEIAAAPDHAGKALAAGDAQLAELASGTASDPAEAERRLQTLLTRLEQDHTRLQSQIASLETAEAGLAGDIDRQSRDLIRLEQLTREAEASRLLYEHFQTRLKETSAQLGLQQAESRLLSEAIFPGRPAAPRRLLILGLSGALGLCLGALFVLLRDIHSRNLRNARVLEAMSGQPVLAQLPRLTGKGRIRALDWLASHPTSAAAEAIRNLRVSLTMASEGREPQFIVLTSAVTGEGKTTITAALARSFAAMGRRVLLIEGDLRKSTLSRDLLPLHPPPAGLVEAIQDPASLSGLAQPIAGYGDLLPGLNAPSDSFDLFASEGFARLIAEARSRYEVVLIDTPPVLAVPDARLIAREADATLFVIRWNQTNRDQLAEALQQLALAHIRLSGLVLSHVEPAALKRSGYGGYYGYGAAPG